MRTKRFILAAGGTGGHLFPAQSLAQSLLAAGYEVVLITDDRFAGYDSRGFAGVEIFKICSSSVAGGAIAKIMAMFRIVVGVWQALLLLRKLRPSLVVGFGGYPSFPVMQAAVMLKLPTVIHEQNILMGRVNRIFAGKVDAIAASFEDIMGTKEEDRQKIVVTGNPVRPQIAALSKCDYITPGTNDIVNILIFGGSQGAHIFSEVMPQVISLLPDDMRKYIRITQQCREEDIDIVRAEYMKLAVTADLHKFIDDMAAELKKAHLVICRAGASTVAEMLVAGRPAIYVPLPHAADNHQYFNAKYIAQLGAGWLISQDKFVADYVATTIKHLLTSPEQLAKAAQHASNMAIVDATERLTKLAAESAKSVAYD